MPQFNLWNWLSKGGDSFMLRGTKKTTQKRFQDLNELVAKKAYELYEKKGRSDGSDMQDWLEAERAVRRSLRRQ